MQLIPLTTEGRALLEQLDRLPMATRRAVRTPLTTPVKLRGVHGSHGVEGVISGHCAEDVYRHRVSCYDPRRQKVHHHWVDQADFDVIDVTGAANCAADESAAQLA